jgi:predicted nucleotidyltransferase
MSAESWNEYINTAVKALLPLLQEVYGQSLVMVALYGSAVTGSWVKGISDINILIIVEKADPDLLHELAAKGGRVLKKYRFTPHILSRSELLSSADIFPAEYLELRSRMKLLYGENLFNQIELTKKNLRHQVESMLRGAVQTLRQLILFSADKDKELQKALRDWAGSQPSLLRALLRLSDTSFEEDEGSSDTAALAQTVSDRFTIDGTALGMLMNLRTEDRSPVSPLQLAKDLQRQYLALLDTVDSYENL